MELQAQDFVAIWLVCWIAIIGLLGIIADRNAK